MERLQAGDIVQHFKYETLSDKEKLDCRYLYKILYTNVLNTETESIFVCYQSLYDGFRVYVRPYDEFMSEVDHDKYPNIKQKYRFEKFEH